MHFDLRTLFPRKWYHGVRCPISRPQPAGRPTGRGASGPAGWWQHSVRAARPSRQRFARWQTHDLMHAGTRSCRCSRACGNRASSLSRCMKLATMLLYRAFLVLAARWPLRRLVVRKLEESSATSFLHPFGHLAFLVVERRMGSGVVLGVVTDVGVVRVE